MTITTRPNASIAVGVTYADGDAHGAYTIGSADRTGTFRWQFRVDDDVPFGAATVGVSAQDRTPTDDGSGASTTGEEGEAMVSIEVSRSC